MRWQTLNIADGARIRRRSTLLIAAVSFAYLLMTEAAPAQDVIRLSGSVSAITDFYGASGIEERRPGSTSRIMLRSTLTITEQIDLPFEAYWSNEENGFRQPFNQFGASPRFWGWLTLHGGYFSSALSDFTFGDQRILGGGIEAQPGKFRFAALYGLSRQARDPDTGSGFAGEYDRSVIAAKIGVGEESAAYGHINVLYALDDTNSIRLTPADTLPPPALENLAISISFGAPFTEKIRLTGEVAVATTTNDTRLDELQDNDIPDIGLTPRTSTQLDGAAKLALHLKPLRVFGLILRTRWVGPGYRTLGYEYLQNDVIEYSAQPTLRLFDNRLFLRGSIGIRMNNLRDNRSASTDRTIGSLNASARMSDVFSLDAQYSNYGVRTEHRRDSLRIDNIFQHISVTPRATFQAFDATNIASITAAVQDVEEQNLLYNTTARNQTVSFAAVYSLAFPSTLSLTTSAFFNTVETGIVDTEILNISQTAGYRFFDGALACSATLGFGAIERLSSDTHINGRFTATYAFERWGAFTWNMHINDYSYGAESIQPSFSEFQTSLQYQLALR